MSDLSALTPNMAARKDCHKTWTPRQSIFHLHDPRFCEEIQQINQESSSESVSTNREPRFIPSSRRDTPPSAQTPPPPAAATPTINSRKLDQL
ncbi:hypothetical protein E2C01_091739 [Portunus trituberculatus]|uniref:Uncharacterized protein n=1 Tax=Portunus trituberculatus TaxID=210409 RepID=A0A5B7JTN1_PORTR|nr:hypothetical protein [Portunus trituberculatus]